MEIAAALGKVGEESCPTRTVFGCKKAVSFRFSQEKGFFGKINITEQTPEIEAKWRPSTLSSPDSVFPTLSFLPSGSLSPAAVQILIHTFSFLIILEPTGLTVKEHPKGRLVGDHQPPGAGCITGG